MKRKVTELIQKVQHSINGLNNENLILNNEKERLLAHHEMQQKNIIETYEDSVKLLTDNKKKFTETLKQSLNDQKADLNRQKAKVLQKIEQASTASERLTRFITNMGNLSYEDFDKFLEELTKETVELKSFANSLPRIELTYMQFHEDMNILDKSLDNYTKRSSLYNKTDISIGLNNVAKDVIHEVNTNDKKMSKKLPLENPNTGARTSRYAKPNAELFSLDEKGDSSELRKFGVKSGITNPFVEESLMAKALEKPALNTAGE